MYLNNFERRGLDVPLLYSYYVYLYRIVGKTKSPYSKRTVYKAFCIGNINITCTVAVKMYLN